MLFAWLTTCAHAWCRCAEWKINKIYDASYSVSVSMLPNSMYEFHT